MRETINWDIFCRVVDNYGDIAVCWRLARQLAGEHGRSVRLWVDRLASFRRLCPRIDPHLPLQRVGDVEVRQWAEPFDPVDPADVVIEAFACDPPARYVEAMAARPQAPVWINLEYLSAEDWVRGCHGLPSPHPRLGLTKYFFFPGFGPGSGGVLRERGLAAQREAFLADRSAVAKFWGRLGLDARADGEVRVSLFSYRNAATAGLLDAWSRADRQTVCLLPEGEAEAAAGFLTVDEVGAGDWFRVGNLRIHVFPFLEAEDYDRLLWACDCNFVRGEDSFVRAQWAERPLVWQIYPQDEGAHWRKLEAFLGSYVEGLAQPAASALREFWEAWNRGAGAAHAWQAFQAQWPALRRHAQDWAARLEGHGDLAGNLAEFVREKVK